MTIRTSTPLGKEAFFRDVLVPTGQVLEVLLKLASARTRDDAFSRLTHDAFEPLNLASCYAINPVNTVLDELATAVVGYRDEMVRLLKSIGQARTPYLAATLGVRHGGSSSKVASAVATVVTQFRRELPRLSREITDAVGYVDAKRGVWLNAQMDTPTPLTRQGTCNRWRTFVRNTSWQRCVELLEITAAVSADKYTNNDFSTAVGVQAAVLLWRETFVAEVTLGGTGAGAAASTAATSRLPVGVLVKSTTSGELEVEADFDPKQFLDKAQVKALKSPGRVLSPAMTDVLTLRKFRHTCDVLSLADAVAAANAWLTEQAALKEAVLAVHTEWLEEMRLKGVRDKLALHFNEDERRLLATVFAREALAAA